MFDYYKNLTLVRRNYGPICTILIGPMQYMTISNKIPELNVPTQLYITDKLSIFGIRGNLGKYLNLSHIFHNLLFPRNNEPR